MYTAKMLMKNILKISKESKEFFINLQKLIVNNELDFYKNFTPDLTPKKMLELGVFGGSYLGDTINEYPKLWFKSAKLSKTFDVNKNYFQIKAGLSLKDWKKKGWIFEQDPRGWFQWYCRFTIGRRIPDLDKVQITRWKAFGPRHIGGIKKNCPKKFYSCRRKQRQALLQWAYNPFF